MQKASEAKIAIRAVDDQVTICANCGLHATIAPPWVSFVSDSYSACPYTCGPLWPRAGVNNICSMFWFTQRQRLARTEASEASLSLDELKSTVHIVFK